MLVVLKEVAHLIAVLLEVMEGNDPEVEQLKVVGS